MYWATRLWITSQAGDHHQHGDEGGEQDQRHRDAVHAQVVVHVEGAIHGVSSTNCIAEALLGQPWNTRKVHARKL
jgi:hypothetical protein